MTKRGSQWAVPRLSAALQRLPPSHPAELSTLCPRGRKPPFLSTCPQVPRPLDLFPLPGPKAGEVAGSRVYPLHNLFLGLGPPLKGLAYQKCWEAAFFISASQTVFLRAIILQK